MFLDSLRESGYICSDSNEDIYVQFTENGDRILTCHQCDWSMSLRHYFYHLVSPKESPGKVEEYVEWSCDDSFPCCLVTSNLRNRAPTHRIITNYKTLSDAFLLLRILQSPFTQQEKAFGPTPAGEHFIQKCLETCLDRMIGECEDKNFSSQSVGFICRNALLFLKNLTAIEVKRYFSVLVPYVKKASWQEKGKYAFGYPLQLIIEKGSRYGTLQHQLQESDYIHTIYSKYCVSFDAVHVAALCFLCQDDLDLVCDLVLDFVFKIARGYFYDSFSWPAEPPPKSLEYHIRELFRRYVSPQMNTPIHRFLQTCQTGGAKIEECFSDAFFTTYWDLKSDILDSLRNRLLDHLEWIFPRVLFQDYTDYYAFLAALAHYSVEAELDSKSINEMVIGAVRTPPKVISDCKAIFRFVKSSLSKVKAFNEFFVEYQLQRRGPPDSDGKIFTDKQFKIQNDYYLSRDMLKRLFEYDTEFEEKLMDASKWWIKLPLYKTNDPDLSRKPFDYKCMNFAGPRDAKQEATVSEVFQEKHKKLTSFEDKWNYYMKKRGWMKPNICD